MAAKEATKVGTKTEASEAGAGAGASAAETPSTAENAMIMTIINATTSMFMLILDSIASYKLILLMDMMCADIGMETQRENECVYMCVERESMNGRERIFEDVWWARNVAECAVYIHSS